MHKTEMEGVTLVCGTCAATVKMSAEDFEIYKKRRSETGTVRLCDKPSTIPGSKQKCLGVLVESR